MKPSQLSYGGKLVGPAPIPFHKDATGAYISACGLFRINRTEHTGRVWGKGRVRWHVRHLPTDDNPLFRFGGSCSYAFSLEDAITDLHAAIGRDVCKAFAVLANWRKEQERERAQREAREASVQALEDKIATWFAERRSWEVEREDLRALAEHLNGEQS